MLNSVMCYSLQASPVSQRPAPIPMSSLRSQVRDCIILKDKVTGQPRGAAFVSYGTREEAETAIQGLNRQVHLPGALQPLEVSRGHITCICWPLGWGQAWAPTAVLSAVNWIAAAAVQWHCQQASVTI
jgi:RNA recognition motif-containing protein